MVSSEGKRAGLRVDSAIDFSVLAKVPPNLIVGKIGSFSSRIVEQIERGLEDSDGKSK